MNTNSNSYTIIYASVMVVIVAFVLAFTSASLRDTQNKNVELDKMKQILHALNVDTKGQDAEKVYKEYASKISPTSNFISYQNVKSDVVFLFENLDKTISHKFF